MVNKRYKVSVVKTKSWNSIVATASSVALFACLC